MKIFKKIKNWFYPPINITPTKYYTKDVLDLFFLRGFFYGLYTDPKTGVDYVKKSEELFNSYYEYIDKKYSK